MPNEQLKERLENSANLLLYLLDLFDGKISIDEMKKMDYSLLLAMKSNKEKAMQAEQERIQKERAMNSG